MTIWTNRQLADKYGTPEAADIFFAGSWNVPLYVKRGMAGPPGRHDHPGAAQRRG